MTGSMSAGIPRDALGMPLCLTRCCVCETPFPEPVENWDDYFVDIEDAAFACATCAEREGYPSDGDAALGVVGEQE